MAKLTLIMSMVSLVRFFIDIFQLSMTEVLANIIHSYQVVFHTCFDLLFFWVPFILPAYLKDVTIFYFLLGFVYQKVIFRKVYFNYKHPWIIQHNYNNSRAIYIAKESLTILKSILLWPNQVPVLFRNPYLIVAYGAHGPSGLCFSREKPDLEKFRGRYYGDGRLMMLIRLLSIAIGIAIVLIFNYAFSI